MENVVNFEIFSTHIPITKLFTDDKKKSMLFVSPLHTFFHILMFILSHLRYENECK